MAKLNQSEKLNDESRFYKPFCNVLFFATVVFVSLCCTETNAFSSGAICFQETSEQETSDKQTGDQEPTDLEKATARIEAEFEKSRKSTVGYPKRISQFVIEGSEVIAKPISDKTQAMIVRIVETFPHGENFRYDIEYKSFEAGKYNIAEFLTRKDGSKDPIPAIDVEVESLLGEGQVLPHELPPREINSGSYYLPLLLAGAAIWVGGLLMILFYGRGKDRRPSMLQQKVTVADRLRPLVNSAVEGKLDSREQAELERVLTSFWSKKLRLSHLPAHDLREHLRQHSEAGVLLHQIDLWLHKPATDGANQVDINEILAPYQSMNYDDIN